jgi:NAD(P)-dependent dehydrogenase (short-subunit alcohol dehydrogenase family)
MKERVIITGSEGLIGRYIKSALADEYAVICFDVALGHDLCDEECVKDVFKQKAEHLINLFAFNDHVTSGELRGTLFDLPLQSFRDCMEVNLTALFSVCREFARNNLSGNIINFGATTGIVSARNDMYSGAHKHVGYSISKAGVIHLTRILAVHLAPKFRVNCISPGGIAANQSDEFKVLYGSHTPMKRMAELSDLETPIRMLLDPKNCYMTGANIIVDGGWTSW